jgi:hypothetical protein
MLELHQSLVKNPINEKAVQQLTEGVKAIFSSLMLGVIDFLVKNPNAINMNKAFGGPGGAGTGTGTGAGNSMGDGIIKMSDGIKVGDSAIKFGKGEIQSAIDTKTGQMFTFDKADYLVASTNEPKEVTIMPATMAQPDSLNITRDNMVDNASVVASKIDKLIEIMASNNQKPIVIENKQPIQINNKVGLGEFITEVRRADISA